METNIKKKTDMLQDKRQQAVVLRKQIADSSRGKEDSVSCHLIESRLALVLTSMHGIINLSTRALTKPDTSFTF